jgi:L-ascorbate metabolism protein UlaG (beta-lactamase superfamily)
MKLTWYGHSAFRVELAGQVVLIDPFFKGNPAFDESLRASATAGVSHIVVTHGHFDHVGDTLAISAATGAKVITNFDLCMWLAAQGLKNFDPMNTGGTTQQEGFSVTLVRADHSAGQVEGGIAFPLGNANGAIIKSPAEKTLWHMGDTDIFSDMALLSEIHGVEACICPVGDRFTMSQTTAALAMSRFVKPKVAIPCHYGSFSMVDQNADGFAAALAGSAVKVLAPKIGETITI